MSNLTSPREGFVKLRQLLIYGLAALCGVTVVLSLLGIAPRLHDVAWAAEGFAAASLIVAAVAWFWARPRVPRRRMSTTVEEFWKAHQTHETALLVLFLFEGSALLAVVGTLLTGLGLATAVAVVPVAGMLAWPGSLEQRTE